MFDRRTLFHRLSAIALAPLVKWLPKREPHIQFQSAIQPCDSSDVVTAVPEWADVLVCVFYKRNTRDSFAKANLAVELLRSKWGYRSPIPQEET